MIGSHWWKKWREFCLPITERSKENKSKRKLLATLNWKPLYTMTPRATLMTEMLFDLVL